MKPHIRLVRGYWEIRVNGVLVGLTHHFHVLKRIGPWRPHEITCEFYGDAKP